MGGCGESFIYRAKHGKFKRLRDIESLISGSNKQGLCLGA